MKKIILVLLSSFIIGGFGGYVFIRYFIPKLGTVSWLQKYHLVPNLGAVVINTKEEVRINEGADSIAAIQKAQQWIVSVISDSGTGPVLAGSALVLSSDGLLATTADTAAKAASLKVALRDGSVIAAVIVARDPFSRLVFMKINANNLSQTQLGAAKDLKLGQRLFGLASGLIAGKSVSEIHYLKSEYAMDPGVIYYSDFWNSSIKIDNQHSVDDSTVLVGLDGVVYGIVAGGNIIPVEAVKSALNSYFENKKIIRPTFGFNYRIITTLESKLGARPAGLLVTKVDNSTGVISGLKEGDIITALDGEALTQPHIFEQLLSSKKAGDKVKYSLLRGKDNMELNILTAVK